MSRFCAAGDLDCWLDPDEDICIGILFHSFPGGVDGELDHIVIESYITVLIRYSGWNADRGRRFGLCLSGVV